MFFLGGQINCSTTIHNQSDILKMLAMSGNVTDEKEAAIIEARKSSRSRRRFLGFRSNKIKVQQRAGMEKGLVEKIEVEKMNLQKKIDVFYTAYSKVRPIPTMCVGPELTLHGSSLSTTPPFSSRFTPKASSTHFSLLEWSVASVMERTWLARMFSYSWLVIAIET